MDRQRYGKTLLMIRNLLPGCTIVVHDQAARERMISTLAHLRPGLEVRVVVAGEDRPQRARRATESHQEAR